MSKPKESVEQILPRIGQLVTIDKLYGRPIGGKRVKVENLRKDRNYSGGYWMKVDKYSNRLSINWIEGNTEYKGKWKK